MFSNWKLDTQHILIALAWLVGVVGAVAGAAAALPAGASAAVILGLILPVALLAINNVLAFIKSPPSSTTQALQEGQQVLGGPAGKRGFGRLGLLLAISALGIAAAFAVELSGCKLFQAEQPNLTTDAEVDIPCVLSAIFSGGNPLTCAGVVPAQLAQILDTALAYYESQSGDAGMAGALPVPFKGIPAAISPAQLAQLKAYRASL